MFVVRRLRMCINKEEKEEEFGSTRPAGFDTGKNELTFREMHGSHKHWLSALAVCNFSCHTALSGRHGHLALLTKQEWLALLLC